MNKLFVGNLSWNTDDNSLGNAFGNYGTVKSAKVITDRETQRSRGFGFVEFENSEDAKAAMNAMHDADLDGRKIRVNMAEDKPARRGGGGGRGGNRGGGGGGYQGGGGGERW